MEVLDFSTLAIIMGLGFTAAFIDSVVGGGGLISVPTLMWAGLPMLQVLGTNKVASVMGAFMGAVTFLRSDKADRKLLKIFFPLSLAGAFAGVLVVQKVPSDFLRPLVVVMLILIAAYSFVRKNWGEGKVVAPLSHGKWIFSLAAIFALGFYDGFFGPGTGSFMLFLFLMMGYGFIGAAANARATNLASNLAAAATFIFFGLVNFSYAIPMGLSMMLGAYCGVKMAITKGAAYVRPLFIIMTVILVGKQLLDLFK